MPTVCTLGGGTCRAAVSGCCARVACAGVSAGATVACLGATLHLHGKEAAKEHTLSLVMTVNREAHVMQSPACTKQHANSCGRHATVGSGKALRSRKIQENIQQFFQVAMLCRKLLVSPQQCLFTVTGSSM